MSVNIARCSKCVLSSEFPNIEFDADGVCNFCGDKMFFISDDSVISSSKKEVEQLFDDHRGRSEYDALVCYSGGKDSTYTLELAVRKYGLKVLAFTFDNGFLSPAAFDNIKRCVDHLGVCHMTIRPPLGFMKRLIKATSFNRIYNRKTLTRISANCNSCISIINNTALRIALEKEIPFIIAGFTLGQIPSNSIFYRSNYRFLQESREPFLRKLRELAGGEVDEYFCIRDSIIDRVKHYPYNINLLCLENITEDEIVEKIRPMGWVPPVDVDGCSSNCYLNAFNNFVHQKSLGYNPYELELSHLIRKGKMTRDEALKKIEVQPQENISEIMRQLDITEKDIEKLSALYRA